MTMQHTTKRKQSVQMFYPLKESLCQRPWQGHRVLQPKLDDIDFRTPGEIFNGMVDVGSNSEFFQDISKPFMISGDEKGVKYVYPVDCINQK